MTLKSMIFRNRCRKSDAARDAGLTTPPDTERFDDIRYGDDPKWQILDVYRPKNAQGRLPVIVSFHGGGWIYGDKEVYQFYCMNLSQRGFAVVNFTYRLAPEFRYPAPFEDVNEVFSWVMNNAERYGFDTDNIFAVGDSAGATGIALYAAVLTNPDYAQKYSFTVPEKLKIKALGLNCGIYDIREEEHASSMKDFLPKRCPKQLLHSLSVVNAVGKDFPPCYIMTSNKDFLKDEPPALMKALDRFGIKYSYKLYGDESAPLYHVFHCDIRSEAAKQANDDECRFFGALISK